MSAKWWDESGPMAPLHRFVPVRIDYILQSLRRRKRLGSADGALASLRVLDIGCGGGILAEPLARLGADMTGIDATPQAIDAAKAHAKAMGLEINYMCCTAEALAETCAAEGQKFDLIYASEVIEHVADRRLFITAIASMLAENGTVVITTINRSLAAFALAKVALEYIVRMVPAGTHDPKNSLNPKNCGLNLVPLVLILMMLPVLFPALTAAFGNQARWRSITVQVVVGLVSTTKFDRNPTETLG